MYGSKLKLLRIIEIMRETSEREPLTAVQICSKLRSYGIDAEKKSVYRDLNLLKEAGYEIVLSEDNKKGYYLAEHLLEDWEVKVLIDAVSQMQFVSAGSSKIIVNKLYMQHGNQEGFEILYDIGYQKKNRYYSNKERY